MTSFLSLSVFFFLLTNKLGVSYRATIATNFSYLIPIVARYTIGRKYFEPAAWNLGRYGPFLAFIAGGYIMLLFAVLLLPQVYPVTAVRDTRIYIYFMHK